MTSKDYAGSDSGRLRPDGDKSPRVRRVQTPARSRRGHAAHGGIGLHLSLTKRTSSLAQKTASHLGPRQRFRVVAGKYVQRLTAQDPPWSSSRQYACVLIDNAQRTLFRRHAQAADQPLRIAGPHELECPRPARAALDNVGKNRDLSSGRWSPIVRSTSDHARSHPLGFCKDAIGPISRLFDVCASRKISQPQLASGKRSGSP